MTHLATPEFEKLFEKYPIKSQDETKNPLVIAKLFDTFGSATWYLTEYDPKDKLAFGYTTGMAHDEYGYISISELESIFHPQFKIPRVERDLYFTSQPLAELVDLG